MAFFMFFQSLKVFEILLLLHFTLCKQCAFLVSLIMVRRTHEQDTNIQSCLGFNHGNGFFFSFLCRREKKLLSFANRRMLLKKKIFLQFLNTSFKSYFFFISSSFLILFVDPEILITNPYDDVGILDFLYVLSFS